MFEPAAWGALPPSFVVAMAPQSERQHLFTVRHINDHTMPEPTG
jgi:hypothetical protein